MIVNSFDEFMIMLEYLFIKLLISCNLFTFVSLERRNIILHSFCFDVIACWLLSSIIGFGLVLIN